MASALSLVDPNVGWTRHSFTATGLDDGVSQALSRFYRRNGYRFPRGKPGDVQYTVWLSESSTKESENSRINLIDDSTTVLGSVRLCPAFSQDSWPGPLPPDEDIPRTLPSWIFLRALCVASTHRRQRWALELLRHVVMQESEHYRQIINSSMPPVYLFCDPSLQTLYEKAGFVRIPLIQAELNEIDKQPTLDVPATLRQRHASLMRRMAPRNQTLFCFGYFSPPFVPQYSNMSSDQEISKTIHIWLLQHHKEVHRPTGTASLVFPSEEPSHWQVSTSTWRGKMDNALVETRIQYLQQRGEVVLVWPGGSKGYNVSDCLLVGKPAPTTMESPHSGTTTFLILDGTWQEAQSMYRKNLVLWSLPRCRLAPQRLSQYTLRGDYGWKDRFAGNDTSLLCTVEVVAEVLEQAGYTVDGEILRQRLRMFDP